MEIVFEKASPETLSLKTDLGKRQTPSDNIFAPIKKWLAKQKNVPSLGVQLGEWESFVEAAFWVARHGYGGLFSKALNDEALNWAVANLPIKVIGDLFQNLSFLLPQVDEAQFDRLQKVAVDRFRDEFKIINVEKERGQVKAHFLISEDALKLQDKDGGKDKDTNKIHGITINCLSLLAYLHPQNDTFGTQGYGHTFPGIQLPHDDTYKDGVKAAYVRSDARANLNGTFLALDALQERPETWNEYAHNVLKIRRQIVSSFKRITNAVTKYFATGKPKGILADPYRGPFWGVLLQLTKSVPKLPKTAVDEWGFYSETKNNNDEQHGPGLRKKPFQLSIYKDLIDSTGNYFRSLGNFASQSQEAVLINLATRNLDPSFGEASVAQIANDLGLNPRIQFLSVHNLNEARLTLSYYQKSFREQLGGFLSANELTSLEKQEALCLGKVSAVWFEYVNHPSSRWGRIDIQAFKRMDTALYQLRERVRSQFEGLSENGWSVSILNEGLLWEGQPALWVLVDSPSAYDVLESYLDTREALMSGVGKLEYSSLEYRAAEHYWHSTIIIPSCNGYLFNKKAWKVDSIYYSDDRDIRAPENSWMHMANDLDDDTINSLALKCYSGSAHFPWKRFKEIVGEMAGILVNMIALEGIPEDLDELGSEILFKHSAGNGSRLSALFGEIHDLYSAAANRLTESTSTLAELDDAKDILDGVADRISLPTDDGKLDLQAMKSWLPQLLESVYALECLAHIDEMLHSDVAQSA